MTTPGDDERLLRLLADMLRPGPGDDPSPASVADLRRVVTEHFRPESVPRRRLHLLRRVAAGSGVVSVVVAGSLGAAAAAASVTGGAIPTPIRQVARAVGLPLDSAPLAQAKRDRGRLEAALRAGDPAPVAVRSTALSSDLRRLSRSDLSRFGPVATPDLQRAAASAGAAPPVATTTTTTGAAPAPTTSLADRALAAGREHGGHERSRPPTSTTSATGATSTSSSTTTSSTSTTSTSTTSTTSTTVEPTTGPGT